MEYLVLILGGAFIFFLAYVIFGDWDEPVSQNELDEMAEEQMRESGLTEEEIDNIQRR